MVNRRLLISASAAVLLGVARAYFLTFCWNYYNAYTPITSWLARSGVFGSALPVVLWPFDLAVSVILSLPVAFVLLRRF